MNTLPQSIMTARNVVQLLEAIYALDSSLNVDISGLASSVMMMDDNNESPKTIRNMVFQVIKNPHMQAMILG